MCKELKTLLLLGTIFLTTVSVNAQDTKLPAPDKKGGSSVMEALWQRKTERTFSDKKLSEKELANLLWAACGVNRPENEKRTNPNPTARNLQEVTVYAFLPDRVCLYEHKTHTLKTIAKGDHRNLLAMGQNFVRNIANGCRYGLVHKARRGCRHHGSSRRWHRKPEYKPLLRRFWA